MTTSHLRLQCIRRPRFKSQWGQMDKFRLVTTNINISYRQYDSVTNMLEELSLPTSEVNLHTAKLLSIFRPRTSDRSVLCKPHFSNNHC